MKPVEKWLMSDVEVIEEEEMTINLCGPCHHCHHHLYRHRHHRRHHCHHRHRHHRRHHSHHRHRHYRHCHQQQHLNEHHLQLHYPCLDSHRVLVLCVK